MVFLTDLSINLSVLHSFYLIVTRFHFIFCQTIKRLLADRPERGIHRRNKDI